MILLDRISLAGDRAKQNDDAAGHEDARAWVIDGATDLHDAPETDAPSDAAWIAARANRFLHGAQGGLRALIRAAAADARDAFPQSPGLPRWKLPTAALLIVEETPAGLSGLDLGDARLYALDAEGRAFEAGGPPDAADNETELVRAAAAEAGEAPLLRHEGTLERLRRGREKHNLPGSYAIFGVQPECADAARAWTLPLARPAHILLATDGFSALVDRYHAYDAGGLVRAALDKGLAQLGVQLRAIEAADPGGALHPRWKRSDDATALLLRLL